MPLVTDLNELLLQSKCDQWKPSYPGWKAKSTTSVKNTKDERQMKGKSPIRFVRDESLVEQL